MSYQMQPFRFRLPWQSSGRASLRPANESSGHDPEPTVQSPELKPNQPPLAPAQTRKRSEIMPSSQSSGRASPHSQPSPSHSRAKNQTRTTSKPSSPSKAIPQSLVASKSPPQSGMTSPSQDASKPSLPAVAAAAPRPANESSRHGPEPTIQSPEIKPDQPPLAPVQAPERSETMSSSQSHKEVEAHSQPTQSQSHAKNQTRTASKPSSPAVAAAAPRSRIASTPPSPYQTSNRNNLNSKPTSQSRLRGDSQPSSPSQSASMSRSPSQADSRQQPLRKTSRVQSPSHLSSKPTGQSTSQQHIASPAAIEDQTTNGIMSRPKSRESQMQTKSKKSPKPNLKPVESKASKNQPQTKEEITSKNTSYPHLNQNSSKNLTQPNQTIENGLEPSTESQAETKETKEIESDKEDLAKTTNASTESSSSFEPEDRGSQQKGITEDIFRVCKKLNIKYTDEENPMTFITLIGDNKGASMHFVSGKSKKERSIHIHREYKRNQDESPENSTDGEGSFKHKTLRDSRTEVDVPLRLCINYNIQVVNSSILFKGSLAERNPGVKTNFLREPTKSEDKSESLHAQKAKYTARPAERLTYDEPIVRRRCLRGLFMESSDSEPDNPEKPRRHGCRYSSCKGKDVEIL